MKRWIRLKTLIVTAALFCALLSVGVTNGAAQGDTSLFVEYIFTGDTAQKAGFAAGEIIITPGDDSRGAGYYLIYYADDTDVLKSYDELASVSITGDTVTYTVKDGIMLPAAATRIAVFESADSFLDEAPSIDDAAAVVDIPPSKRLLIGTPEISFGAVSDVHMNYQSYGRGAYQKWENVMAFFVEQEMDYILVAGDMTGDSSLEMEYEQYISTIENSGFPVDRVFETIGNHGNTLMDRPLFVEYTSGEGEDHPYENSPYYSVLIEAQTEDAHDNLIIVMAQELRGPSDTAAYENFSKKQIDWLEGLLEEYGNSDTNIFIIEHAPFLDFGAGERVDGGYRALIPLDKTNYKQTTRLKGLLETYKDVIVMSGHTHLTFYDEENYSNEGGTFAHTVHIGSTCQPCGYDEQDAFVRGTDGRYTVNSTYGSEAYVMEVYSDCVIYTGYNMSTGKIIPAACLLIPTKEAVDIGTAAGPDPAPFDWAMWVGVGVIVVLLVVIAAGVVVIVRLLKAKPTFSGSEANATE